MPRKQLKHPDNYYKAFPSRLRLLMSGDAGKIKRTVSQQELADYLDLKARQSVSAYCDGSGQPSWENIIKIATYFGVSTDWLLGITDIETVRQDIRSAQKTLGLSDRAVENLAKVARMKRYPRLSSFHTELDKQILGTALDFLLSSEETLIGIARNIYDFYDASAKMREIENLTVEDLCQTNANDADYNCIETFKDYRLARLDLNESLLAITNDRMEFLKATQAQRIVDDFYTRLEEAEKLSEQQANQAADEWAKTCGEEQKELLDYLEKEGLDEDYGSDETEEN